MRKICLFMGLLFALLTWSSVEAQESTPSPETTETAELTVEPEATAEPEVTETASPAATQTPTTNFTTYIVRPGDTLFRIALNNRTTVAVLSQLNGIANPRLIYVGQELRIPTSAPTPTTPTATPSPTPTPDQPTTTGEYVVRRGDTLYRIAVNNNTTVARLVSLNNITNPNVIFIGQRILLPDTTTSTTVTTTATPASETDAPIADVGFAYGIEIFVTADNLAAINSQLGQLGVSWVKMRVDWREIQPDANTPPDLEVLDAAINAFNDAGFNLLLTVTSAPNWSRPSATSQAILEDGPPDDFANYATFIGTLASRYSGIVDAYEIWDEPNLRREWNSSVHPIGVRSYIELLRAAHSAIKNADPEAKVITAGLAPTGFNDGLNAVDDRVFLQDLFSNQVGEVADAIGAHPNGWANPPDAVCCAQPAGVDTHYDNPRFYFRNTLEDYRAIIRRNNASDMPIWVTRFGWGSSEGNVLAQPSTNNVFFTYTSQSEQALYIPRAFEFGRASGYVGPMFLNNLNACSVNDTEGCFYSLIDASGSARPAFNAFISIEKTTSPADN